MEPPNVSNADQILQLKKWITFIQRLTIFLDISLIVTDSFTYFNFVQKDIPVSDRVTDKIVILCYIAVPVYIYFRAVHIFCHYKIIRDVHHRTILGTNGTQILVKSLIGSRVYIAIFGSFFINSVFGFLIGNPWKGIAASLLHFGGNVFLVKNQCEIAQLAIEMKRRMQPHKEPSDLEKQIYVINFNAQ
ncbi:RDD domain-containing protein [Caenorhabditis elegans]|uniref:RDD domain-containing protein n=1 Tax=Caenorhabditis elegans TaxID=6239 RepID=Q21509_CAEEL|nr:RDD domain-containing protein [Caenorhabditis elegans]CAA83612.2 RDD domain-containing protein [Caenorhabditis elegans]|eukprot:NP_499225.2 Uncharacterized protein CELE_M04D8.4 [Caenorhabditis elegans]